MELIGIRTNRVLFGSGALLISTFITFATGLILAGVVARYFSVEEFGLWGIVISLNGIFLNGFDWGFGNALRNRLAQVKALGNSGEGRIYFLSTFFWFLCSALILTSVFWLLKPFIPWDVLLRSENRSITNLGASLFVIGGSLFALNVAFNIYSAGFFGYQESHWNAFFNSVSKLAVLAVTTLSIFLGMSFFFVNISAFLAILASSIFGFASFLFIRKWPLSTIGLRRFVDVFKELWRKSAQFAVLQVFSTILLNADLLVVSKSLGLGEAGDYFIVKRLYLVVSTLHFAFLLPIWSAYTESVEVMDYSWAKKTLLNTSYFTVALFLAGTVAMMLFGQQLALFWTGKRITNAWVFFWMGSWSILYGWNNCFSVFLNALGRLKRQAGLVSIGTVLFFPIGVFFGERWGLAGVCWALILAHIPVALSNPYESFCILKDFDKDVRRGDLYGKSISKG